MQQYDNKEVLIFSFYLEIQDKTAKFTAVHREGKMQSTKHLALLLLQKCKSNKKIVEMDFKISR